MKPIIGLNLDLHAGPPSKAIVRTNYLDAIEHAGGIPILLPPIPDGDIMYLLQRVDGLCFIGGDDYSAGCYGDPQSPLAQLIDPRREVFDLSLIRHAFIQTRLPILGICGGCQLLNIARGGTLIQDIPSALPDSQVTHTRPKAPPQAGGQAAPLDSSPQRTKHIVKLEAGSELAKIYKTDSLDVPTSHHQAVKTLGDGLKPTAYAEDGIIEAIEHQDRPFTIGVQWHPERDYQGNKSLFETFIEFARTASAKV